jgi:hypothetical protein
MRRYPSGDFSELAQMQLDRVLALQGEQKVVAAPQEGNPYTKGSAVIRNFRIGDSYQSRRMDLYSKSKTAGFTAAVQRIEGDLVHFGNGMITDVLGNIKRFPDGRTMGDNQNVPAEFVVANAG